MGELKACSYTNPQKLTKENAELQYCLEEVHSRNNVRNPVMLYNPITLFIAVLCGGEYGSTSQLAGHRKQTNSNQRETNRERTGDREDETRSWPTV